MEFTAVYYLENPVVFTCTVGASDDRAIVINAQCL